MNMNGILEQIQMFDINEAIMTLEDAGHVLTQTETLVLAVLCAAGVLFCLLGLKIVRFWAGLLGLLLGMAGGTVASYYFGLEEPYIWIPGAVAGIVLAVLGAWRYRFGVFLTVWVSAGLSCVYIIRPADWIWGAACLAAGLVLALLAMRFVTLLTMIVTAAGGAVLGGTAAYFLTPFPGLAIHIVICTVLGIFGFFVQLMLESRKRKKQNLKKAAEIRDNQSTENEVEKARALVDELDEENVEESDELEFIQFDVESDDEEIDDLEDDDEIDYLDSEEETDNLEDDDEIDYLDEEEIDYLDEETEEKTEK